MWAVFKAFRQLKRNFRLSKPVDFQRVRRLGKSQAHPLLVLITMPNGLDRTRVGFAAGRSIGNAVKRNRAKRVLREAMRPLMDNINTGQDIVLLARTKLLTSQSKDIEAALSQVIKRSGLVSK